jgi:hypothetical protein
VGYYFFSGFETAGVTGPVPAALQALGSYGFRA